MNKKFKNQAQELNKWIKSFNPDIKILIRCMVEEIQKIKKKRTDVQKIEKQLEQTLTLEAKVKLARIQADKKQAAQIQQEFIKSANAKQS